MRRPLPLRAELLPMVLVAAFSPALCARAEEGGLSARRMALIHASEQGPGAIPVLKEALAEKSGVLRRTAVRLLGGMGAPARDALATALESPDPVLRRAALFALASGMRPDDLPYLKRGLDDQEAQVRCMAVEILSRMTPRTEAVEELLLKAQSDSVPSVRGLASEALWPFYRKVVLLSQRKDWDHEIELVQSIPLPNDGWLLKTDPGRSGHLAKWFEPALDDSQWSEVGIDKAWEHYGHKWDGIAWYRRKFTLPAKPDHLAAEIHFGAVDESAWVWMNGQYIGQHDIGPFGWNRPFRLDATKALKWRGENQITVRVLDTKMAGGIWKPVSIEVLK